MTLSSNYTLAGITLNDATATLSIGNQTETLNPSTSGSTNITAGTLNLANTYIQATGAAAYAFNNGGTINSTGSTRIFGTTSGGLQFTNTGLINVTSGTMILGSGTADTVVNSGGTITVTGAGILSLNGGLTSIANSGTLTASGGGTINFGGSFTNADLGGTINGTSGTLNITGTLTNGTLAAPDGGGVYILNGGTIVGGTVPTSALILANSGFFNGVTYTGSATLSNYNSVTFENGSVLSGGTISAPYNSFSLNGASGTALTIASNETVTGNDSFTAGVTGLTMENDGTIINTSGTSYIEGSNTGFNFLNTGHISSTGGTLFLGDYASDVVMNSSSGIINADGGTINFGGAGASATNSGTLESTTAGSTLNVGFAGHTWTNAMGATIEASGGGIVNLAGDITNGTLTLGTIGESGGILNITGMLTNGTLAAPNGGGVYTLSGGTIMGGTVPTSALILGNSGYFNDVAYTGSLTLSNYNSVTFENGSVLSGGTITAPYSGFALNGSSGTALTIASNETVTGNASFTAGVTGLTMENDGTIIDTSGTSYIEGSNTGFNFLNTGHISSTSGTLFLGDYPSDVIMNSASGIINADGGTINFGGAGAMATNYGTLESTTTGSILNVGYTGYAWTNEMGATIEASGGGVVNLAGSMTNGSLTLGTIGESGGTLNITGMLTNGTLAAPNGGGVYTLSGGTIMGGTVPTSALILGNSGYFNDVAYTGSLTLSNYNSVTFENGSVLSGGTITAPYSGFALNGASGTALTIASNETVTGNASFTAGVTGLTMENDGTIINTSGTSYIEGSNSGFNFLNTGHVSSTSGTLFLGDYASDVVMNSSSGIINADGGTINFGGAGAMATNYGTLESTTTGSILNVGYTGYAWTNEMGATIEASGGGVVNLAGNMTNGTLTLGTIGESGGTLNITGKLTNGTLAAPNGGGVYTLSGGTITGGTVPSSALVLGNSGFFYDVDYTGSSTLSNYNSVTFENGSVLSGGTITAPYSGFLLNGPSGTALTIASNETVTGNASFTAGVTGLTMENDGTIINTSGGSYIEGSNSGFTFLNTANVSSTGGTLYLGDYASDIIMNSASGVINADGGTIDFGWAGAMATNAGTLESTTAASILNVGYTGYAWSNAGGHILVSGGGVVNLAGNITDPMLIAGTIDSLGGTINLVGMLANTTLDPPNGGGIFTLAGGTITGGTVDSNAIIFGASGGILSGVTMSGNFSAQPGANYSNFHSTGTTNFTGGTTTFTTSGGYDNVYLDSAGQSLAIASGATWTGEFDIAGRAAGATMTNAGTLAYTANTNTFDGGSYGGTLNNSGAITATNSGTIVQLGYYANDDIINSGTITANTGTTIELGHNVAAWANTGTITANAGGIVILDGAYNNASFGGSFNALSTGVIDLAGAFTNTTTLAVPTTGVFTLDGATITGGTVASGALIFGSGGGVLSGVTMSGNFNAQPGANYSNFHSAGTTNFTGGTTTFTTSGGYDNVYLDSAGQSLAIASGATWTGEFDIAGRAAGATMTNAGTIAYTANTNTFDGGSYGATLNNSGAITATNSGTIVQLGYYANDHFINSGTITANTGTTIDLGHNVATWANTGTVTANAGGIIILNGAYNDASFGGSFNALSTGLIDLAGAFTNTTTLAVPTTGVFTLDGATITGGTVASGALIFGSGGGVLSGVTMSGNFNAQPGANYSNFHSAGTTNFTGGTTTFTTSGGYDNVYLDSAGQSLAIASGATWTGEFDIAGRAAGATMTNAGTLAYTANTNTFDGGSYGGTLNNSGAITATNSGTIVQLGYYANDDIINSGTITANTGTTIDVGHNVATWANTGTVTANAGGIVILNGAYNDASFGGSFNALSTGVIDLAGTFTNTTNLAAPTTGAFTLDGATINGGSVASGALIFGSSSGTLNGVTMNGNFSAPTGTNYANFHASGSTTFNGGTTTFSSNSGYDNVYITGSGASLTVGATEVWSGSFNLTAQTATETLNNLGTINLAGSSNAFNGSNTAFTFTNTGVLNNTGSTVDLGYYSTDTFTNAAGGEVETSGGTILVGYNLGTVTNLASNTLTNGIWDAASGGAIDFFGTTNAIVTNHATLILDGTGSNIQTRTGAGSTYQTVEQTLTTNAGTIEVLSNRNFSGSNAITNSGTIQLGGGTFTSTSLTNSSGAVLAGNGTFSPTGGTTIGSGVTVSPGTSVASNYVNTLSFNSVTLGGSGSYTFDLVDASGVAGTGYDTLTASGTSTITASSGTPFAINLVSINSGTGLPGMANFNNSLSYQWTILAAPSLTNFNATDFTINTSGFTNSLGTGNFFVSSNGSDLFLNFTPVPEPSTWALMGAGAAAIGVVAWRRRSPCLSRT